MLTRRGGGCVLYPAGPTFGCREYACSVVSYFMMRLSCEPARDAVTTPLFLLAGCCKWTDFLNHPGELFSGTFKVMEICHLQLHSELFGEWKSVVRDGGGFWTLIDQIHPRGEKKEGMRSPVP